MKVCILCNKRKPFSDFHKNVRNHDGHDNRCKQCKSEKARENRIQNYFESYIGTKKSECRRKEIPFDLTADYIESLWTGVCPIFNVPIIYGTKGRGSHHRHAAHLDRLRPDEGYVKGNVAWISGRANRIKYDATSDELRKIADWIERAETIENTSNDGSE